MNKNKNKKRPNSVKTKEKNREVASMPNSVVLRDLLGNS